MWRLKREKGGGTLKPLILGLFIGQGLGFKGRKPESWPYTCMSRIPTRVPVSACRFLTVVVHVQSPSPGPSIHRVLVQERDGLVVSESEIISWVWIISEV